MPLKIYFLTWDYYPFKAGGAERYVLRMSECLQKRGHTVSVITRRHYSTRAHKKLNDVPIHRIDCMSWLTDRIFEYLPPSPPGEPERYLWLKYIPIRGISAYIQRLLFMKRTKQFFLDKEKQTKCAVIIPMLDWLAGWSAISLKPNGIAVIGRGSTLMSPIQSVSTAAMPYKQKIEAGLKKMSAYIALTPEMKSYLQNNGILEEKITVIPNGVYLPAQTANVEINTDILCVANFTQGRWKGFDTLFQAWKIVAPKVPDSRLLMVGNGDATPYLKVAGCNPEQDRIVLIGHSNSPEKFYMSAGVFVLPSRMEGLSIALLEAQSFGLPAVVSDISGNKNVVTDGYNGFIVPVDNVTMLAEKILELLGKPELRRVMGQNARRIVREKFDISMLAVKTEELCYSVIEQINNN
jgi:glycosyltransferase involved in cell wall biosynthesis